MKKLTHYVPVLLDAETLALLQMLMDHFGKSKKSIVIRAAIMEYARTTLIGKP